MTQPKKYKAKLADSNEFVTGWYAELHIPHYDNSVPDRIVGYDTIYALFNDDKGERSKGSYWHTIDKSTLEEAQECKQLTLSL